jgi:hypothetical protein
VLPPRDPPPEPQPGPAEEAAQHPLASVRRAVVGGCERGGSGAGAGARSARCRLPVIA